jgi:hypothetical protein
VDPAAFELSGHLVLKRAADFEAVSEDSCWRLLECASLDEVRAAQPQGRQPPCCTLVLPRVLLHPVSSGIPNICSSRPWCCCAADKPCNDSSPLRIHSASISGSSRQAPATHFC